MSKNYAIMFVVREVTNDGEPVDDDESMYVRVNQVVSHDDLRDAFDRYRDAVCVTFGAQGEQVIEPVDRGNNKISLIKAIREVADQSMGLKEAKDLVEAPLWHGDRQGAPGQVHEHPREVLCRRSEGPGTRDQAERDRRHLRTNGMTAVIDLSQVATHVLQDELARRRPVPRLPPPSSGVPWARKPVSSLVDVVSWSYDPTRRTPGTPWDRCAARLLSPVSGVDALDLSTPDDVGDVIAGLLLARPLVADPRAGWTVSHRGLSARALDEEEGKVFCAARALRWPR